jgi:hypothetical protein
MKRYDHDQMHVLFEQWLGSGLTKKDFALSHQINPVTFYYWAKKFEKTNTNPAAGFQRITISEPADNTQGELMAAIQYPSGTRLELYSSFQNLSDSYAKLLKSLIQ